MSSAADDLRKVPVLVVSDSGEEGPDVTARLLCLVTKGQFDRTYVNLSNVKAALVVAAGLGAATGGADFREAELGHVKSKDTLGGFVMRPLTVEGGDALVGWCAVGTGRIFVLKGLVFAEGGSADPVDVEVNCSAFDCSGDRGGDVDAGELGELVYVNLSTVKGALAVAAGLGAATGGADFREAELKPAQRPRARILHHKYLQGHYGPDQIKKLKQGIIPAGEAPFTPAPHDYYDVDAPPPPQPTEVGGEPSAKHAPTAP